MQKSEAISLLGGTVEEAAKAIRITSSAISQWPEVLPPRLQDRVLAACLREEIAIPVHFIRTVSTEEAKHG